LARRWYGARSLGPSHGCGSAWCRRHLLHSLWAGYVARGRV